MSLTILKKPFFLKTLSLCLLVTLMCLPDLEAKPRDQERWNKKYNTETFIFGKEPVPFLKQNLHLLPKGRALDIAMGEGRNGVYLATRGYEVIGLDISPKGLAKAHLLAKQNQVTIETQVVDLENYQLKENAY
ncbi:MAG: methyltransferase domain-containing protein, partial [Nitrospinaceae bacterium]|nr:class I SAM-dependent methyltransferase [Nitrospinaceae bacterium]NIR53667.1 class I SAM-dependent methyltransferase [Nitrospinaceae bacterium]NIS84074.1 class I SAM-dependent methyltransferase [Nitrospinaceae bacterium]NIT80875.1 class I SAM-dependent methyltransferase [Nitrospinaceae bacterium]NIU43177.1 class I SAM-dependent methyltransferase [Nitrospinaceae bacterium]